MLGLGWLLNAAFQASPTKTNCQLRHWLAARLRLERAVTDTSASQRGCPAGDLIAAGLDRDGRPTLRA